MTNGMGAMAGEVDLSQGDEYVVVGTISRPHGLKGEIRLRPDAGTESVLLDMERFFISGPEGPVELRPSRLRLANRYVIVGFVGYRSKEEAEGLRAKTLYARCDDLPTLGEGEVYQFTQLGLEVVTEEGEKLGAIRRIVDSAAHPILEIETEEGEILLPAVAEFVLGEEDGRLVVRIPDGLLESQQ